MRSPDGDEFPNRGVYLDVVKNERRQNYENAPYGMAWWYLGEALYPVGHPYRHSTIGSMADLSAADLADVRKWFKDNYGPNNVVLALTCGPKAAYARLMLPGGVVRVHRAGA